MNNKYADVWNKLHKSFNYFNEKKYDDWLVEYNDIIKDIDSEIIDLGCGVSANNTIYLLEKGKKVISCDFSYEAINRVKEIKGSKTVLFDMLEDFPFEDNCTDLVIADLSLHYFRKNDTIKIINEIKRILKPNGYMFFRLNSVNSTEYKNLLSDNKNQIEENLFFANNMEKRFFSREDIEFFFKDWKIFLIKEENMTRWSSDKIVWKCGAVNIK